MELYRPRAVERVMKVQEVILRAMSGQIRWFQAAEIIGVSPRTMRLWRRRYEEYGYDGLYDRRLKRPSPRLRRCCGCTKRRTGTSRWRISSRSCTRKKGFL